MMRWVLMACIAGPLTACQQSYSLGKNQTDAGVPRRDAVVIDSSPPDSSPDRDVGASAPCFVGGCSSQLCSAEEGISSTCEWREEYACYREATCERQTDGSCNWTSTPELRACLDAGGPAACVVSGCNSEICADEALSSPCVVLPEHACYQNAICERQATGECSWTQTPELTMCLDRLAE